MLRNARGYVHQRSMNFETYRDPQNGNKRAKSERQSYLNLKHIAIDQFSFSVYICHSVRLFTHHISPTLH